MSTKRFTLIAALLLCSALSMHAEHVDLQTAQKVASSFLSNNGAKTVQLTDLSNAAGFANLYIFTTDEGFVVMAADDCVQPILGYSLTDSFSISDMPENLRWWLQGYDDQIADAVASKAKATAKVAMEWKELVEGTAKALTSEVVVEPLTATLWDQNKYYNRLCPTASGGPDGHVYTGCVATAMAQVMKYWNYPTTGNGSHTYTHSTYGELTANFGETTYHWEDMPNQLTSSSTSDQINAIATLMYHCGVSVDMNYGTSSSGASSNNVPSALTDYFLYSPSATFVSRSAFDDDQWKSFLKNELDESRPLYYRGNNENSGHAFVCDGYRSDDYFHFNWGWSGSKNGYWEIGALNPGSGGSGSGSGTYNLDNAVIAWAEPLSTLTAPTITAATSEGSIIISWNAIEGAEHYDIYRDNMRLATGVTSNSYTDNTTVSGTNYEYYVRAVSNELRSNPSNRVNKFMLIREYTPTHLTLTHTDNAASLTWTEPENNPGVLQYATSYSREYYGMGDNLEAEVFSPSRLHDFIGMGIQKVSSYFRFNGTYTLFIFQRPEPNDESEISLNESNKLAEQQVSVTSQGWTDIEFPNLVLIDCDKELWIVMYCPYEQNEYPAPCGNYDEIQYDDEEDEERYNPRYIGKSLQQWYYVDDNISWLFKTYLTDGTYTYNIYDGETKLNEEGISGNTFTHANPATDAAHQYTVKTNYYGGESDASNMAGFTFGTASLNSLELGDNDKMTLTENSQLTVSGTMSNNNAENLVLENGAQLIHNSEGVKATVKKDIAPYTANNNGWHFVAAPVTESFAPTAENGFLNGDATSNTYDLYYYDEPNHQWMNYESQSFGIEHKKGYLYANGETTGSTLQFAGTLAPSNNAFTISNLSHSATSLNGFNLVGNPFACNASVNKSYYIINGNRVTLAEAGRVVAPCEAVMVQASESDESVTFSKAQTRSNAAANSFDIVLTQGRADLDRARVRLSGDETLEKFSLNGDNGSKIYLPRDGKDYAVACAEGLNELPLNFKAAKNGTYTLNFELGNAEMDYLHLIDNMTGTDVDLLSPAGFPLSNGGQGGFNEPRQAEYTFTAKTTDYPSRFRLMFASTPSTGSGADGSATDSASTDETVFAYVSNGEIHLVETQNFASLQIIDMRGRVIFSRDGVHTVSTKEMAPGVYVLRLISGNEVKTQKIVIE